MVEGTDLAFGFAVVAEDRIVSSLDVDGAVVAAAEEGRDDGLPGGVAESGEAVVNSRIRAGRADLSVLAVDVGDAGRPAVQLREGIESLADLVGGFPLEGERG